jgi:hypothetical protein
MTLYVMGSPRAADLANPRRRPIVVIDDTASGQAGKTLDLAMDRSDQANALMIDPEAVRSILDRLPAL